jgi:preprotein translocase subunit SecB
MSALQLERHFFTRIDLRSIPEGKRENATQIITTVTKKRAKADPSRFQITLVARVEQAPEAKGSPFYLGEVEIVGLFRVAAEYSDDPDKLAGCNGASLLFGAVRELLCNLTARGPWPMLTVATINFSVPGNSESLAKAKSPPEHFDT